MTKPEHALRFEAALQAGDPTAALGHLAEELKAEGISQAAISDLFTEYFVKVQKQGDEKSYDPIADTLDRITGWCSHGCLFDAAEFQQYHTVNLCARAMSMLPQAPTGQQWMTFTTGPVAFLIPSDFSTHREEDDTIAAYPAGDSGVTLRFSLHIRPLQAEMPPDAAERFVIEHAAAHGLPLTRLADRVFLTESREADWPDRRVLMHYWQIGCGRILVVGSATIWGADRASETVRRTLESVPQIIQSLRLT